ncbi:hypothetical protein RVR_7798 [Actinacidiphila reveromycinica]|uniref:Uncharacterized protein n=1 Tax=Actinacidiphila reveromycinica TaxID=659352 RepID=A0A7U3UXK5_9ACTN|nr:hypothetical protein [Streptomyces sp. SN-593]BBB00698.1 hypothetical protein RVR_7798 [Streptomyces sp. SN-593]
MPLTPEEPQIHESVPGPRTAPAAGRNASTPRPVPGPPRPAAPRPTPSRESAAAGVGPGRPGPHRPAGKPGPVTPTAPPATLPAQRSAKGASAQIQLIPAPEDGAVDAADETVDLLLDTGRAPGEILVLTAGEHHPWAAHELSFGEASYWAQYDAADDVFYADIRAGRATGRPVVVVALNGGDDEDMSRALADALSRAGVLLIVCGDTARINGLLGASA